LNPERILILKPSSLGDVIQALPVLRILRRRFPQAEIYWWVDRELAPLIEDDPDLTGVCLFYRRGWSGWQTWQATARSLWRMRRLEFDWVLDLQALARSGLIAWFSGGRRIVGLDDPREGAPTFYDTAVPRPGPRSHAVEWYLKLVEALDVAPHWDFEWIPPRPQVQARIAASRPEAGAVWIGVQPGARWRSKRWPERHFAETVARLAEAVPEARFAIFGSRAELDAAVRVAAGAPEQCAVLAGKISLPEMVEWLRRCAVVLTNDTGPMHVAAALRRPLVALFGPTDPARTGPYGQAQNVLRAGLDCSPCFRSRCPLRPPNRCMELIRPEEAAAKALELLREGTDPAPAPWRASRWGEPTWTATTNQPSSKVASNAG